MQLCPVCREVRYKIGVPIWPDMPDSARVCSTKCAVRRRREARQEAREEEQEIEQIGQAIRTIALVRE